MQGIAVIGKMFFWLVLVGLLAYASSRLLAQRAQGLTRSRRLAVLESVALGPRRHLCLVRVDEQVLCLGVTDKHITLICELTGETALVPAAGAGEDDDAPAMGLLPELASAGRFAAHLLAKGTALVDMLRRGGGSRG